MGNFITGILIENEDGATDNGVVYDRFLKLRLQDGQILSIFDPFEPISTHLAKGKVYEMALAVLPVSVSYFPTNPPPLKAEYRQGTIIDTNWRPTEGNFRFASNDFYNRDWVLLQTSIGHLLMDDEEIEIPASPGGFVQWEEVRLDLCAVV